ncbi:MAG TPA: aspartyl protease family protein [Kofleriaceae bacterium]|nr:aspartyl protease family protein [Kofleriaceae bacterium]
MAAALGGCAGSGAPAGFSKGDHWTFPLVGPLEDGVLIAPATVHGKGPYLFVIDPDANVSSIDQLVATEAQLTRSQGPTFLDEAGAEQMRQFAELIDLQLGTLAVERRTVMLVPPDFYNTEGRRVNGVIGRDVLGDALVFGFDRDQGIAMLSTVATFTPPPDAIAIHYDTVEVDAAMMAAVRGHTSGGMESSNTDDASRIGVVTRSNGDAIDPTPVMRRVAAAQIGGAQVSMHLDLGGPVSALREPLWSKVKAQPAEVKRRLVDEVATVREITQGAVASDVSVGAAKAPRITLVPYADKRFAVAKVDGSLGLDFFRPYAVFANWAAHTYYLKPRGDAAATTVARAGRWGTALPTCPHPGCVTASLTATPGGTRLDVVRDAPAAKRALEIRIGVTPAAGKSASALIVELPADVDKISGGVPENYEGATVTVLDASPFTRPCDSKEGCVYQFDAPAGPAAK